VDGPHRDGYWKGITSCSTIILPIIIIFFTTITCFEGMQF
jgi:hypothetical protein